MRQLLYGLLSGLCATAPMTMVMVIVHRMLPGHEQHPLPPYEITMRASGNEGGDRDAGGARDEDQDRVGLALISHFAFGAGAGAVYSLLAKAIPLSGAPAGAVYGLVVWGVNYLGVLPVTGLYRAPDYEPPRRHAMMILAHLVWGSVLGLLFRKLAQEPQDTWDREGHLPPSRRPLVTRPTSPVLRDRVSQERYSY